MLRWSPGRKGDLVTSYGAKLKRHTWIATGLALLGGPYVLLTNTTASPAIIFIHILALWLVVPPVIALVDPADPADPTGRDGGAASTASAVVARLAAVWAGLALAVGLALLIIHVGTKLPWSDLLVPALATALVPVASWYALVVLFEAWQAGRERALRLETAGAQAAWAALSARIQPHFLFNSLASLEQLTTLDPPRAAAFVRRLAALYRRVLAAAEQRTTKLSEELALVEDYFHVQTTRFAHRLTVAVEAPAALGNVPVPPTLLLTLAENAVKHGIEGRREKDTIRVDISEQTDHVLIRVSNHVADAGAESAPAGGEGIPAAYGHRDVTERLRLVYGDAATFAFHIDSAEGSSEMTAVAEVRLPLVLRQTAGARP
jgi:hypothetical protein